MYFETRFFASPMLLNIVGTVYLLTSPLIAMQQGEIAERDKLPSILSDTDATSASSNNFNSFEQIEQKVQKQYPKYFWGSDKLDLETMQNYRKSWVNFRGKNRETFSVFHNPTLLSALEKLEKDFASYAEIHSNHITITNRFIREIQFYKESENITPSWFDKLPFRFLCATSTISPQERDFISHLTEPYPTLFLALKEGETWKNHESTVASMDKHNYKILGLPTFQYSILSNEIVQEIKERIEKKLQAQIIYPLWGTGKVGVSFIVKEMLNDVFLVGVPLKNLNVHGIPSSPYGFAVHDLFHKSVDHRHFKFIQHVIDQGERYVRNGGSIQKFLSTFLPSALSKYQGMIDGLKEIYQRIICTFDQPDSRKAMLGFFWILHEEPNFPSYLYTIRNFDDILKILTEDAGNPEITLSAIEDHFPQSTPMIKTHDQQKLVDEELTECITAGVDLNDHFETSPLDGKSQWTDEEIIEWVVKNKKVREARKYELIGYFGEDDDSINQNDIVSESIKRSPRYIDVTFTLRQGEVLIYSFQTLFYNLQATHDALRILELINIKINLPDLSSTDNPRAVAQAFIKKGEEEIDGLITHFRKVASSFANQDISEKGSLVKRYEQLYDMSNLSLF